MPGGFGQKNFVVAKVPARRKLDKAIQRIDKQITDKSKQLATERKKPADKKSQKVDWVTLKPALNPVLNFHEKYKVPPMAMFKMSAGNFCLDKDGSKLPRVRPHLWNCSRKNGNQKFGIGVVSGDYFALVSRDSKMCMDVYDAATHHGQRVIQYPCHYNANQQWMAVSPGKKATDAKTFAGKFHIKNRKSGKCLAPTTVEAKVVYSKADQAGLKNMPKNMRERCGRNDGFRGSGFIECPRGKTTYSVVSKTRKKARFAQVNCKASDRNQLFTLLR
jgi:hypothetical protein